MNQTIETILARRSARQFKSEQIKDGELNEILSAGQYAPSAMNQQSWHITAVQNSDSLKKIADTYRNVFLNSGVERYMDMAKQEDFSPFYHAPTVVFVFGDKSAIAPVNDGTLVIGNMLLAAESLGIGGCWLHGVNHVFAKPEVKALQEEMGIPAEYVPVGSAAFGYRAAEKTAAAPRREGTVNIIK